MQGSFQKITFSSVSDRYGGRITALTLRNVQLKALKKGEEGGNSSHLESICGCRLVLMLQHHTGDRVCVAAFIKAAYLCSFSLNKQEHLDTPRRSGPEWAQDEEASAGTDGAAAAS